MISSYWKRGGKRDSNRHIPLISSCSLEHVEPCAPSAHPAATPPDSRWLTSLTASPVTRKLLTVSSTKALIFHSTVKQVINPFYRWISTVLLLDGDISHDLTPCLKIDDTVYNARIFDDILRRLGGRLQCLSPRRWRWRADSHGAGRKWQTLISATVSLPFLLFPQWTSAHVDPHPPWKKQNGDPWNEMPSAALLATLREREKNKNNKK